MGNLSGFNAGDHEPSADFEAIPAGKYVAIIEDSGFKDTKAGTGKYLEMVFQIIDGEFHGRKLWSRLNLDNPNEAAVQIAQGELSAICRAVGVMDPGDSAELHDKPILITVKLVKRSDNDEMANEISGYKAVERAGYDKAEVPDEMAGVADTGSTAADTDPPWQRRRT